MSLETLNQLDVWANFRHPKWRGNPPAYDKNLGSYDPVYVTPRIGLLAQVH